MNIIKILHSITEITPNEVNKYNQIHGTMTTYQSKNDEKNGEEALLPVTQMTHIIIVKKFHIDEKEIDEN
jgi:hypothetical protein